MSEDEFRNAAPEPAPISDVNNYISDYEVIVGRKRKQKKNGKKTKKGKKETKEIKSACFSVTTPQTHLSKYDLYSAFNHLHQCVVSRFHLHAFLGQSQ